MKKISDDELIEQVKSGSEAAFEELYQRFHKLVYFYAYQLCKNDADAKDILQETFVEVHRSISGLKENSYFKSWMYRIVNSKCSKLFRKNKYITNDFENDALTNEIREDRIEFNPEHFSHFKNDQELLFKFIEQLSTSQKSIVILFYLEEMSLKEISECMDVPLGTVKSRLSYARNYLKKGMENYYKVNEEKLTFHSLDALITATLVKQASICDIGVIGFGCMRLIQKARLHFIPACLTMGTILLTACGGILIYDQWHKEQSLQLPAYDSTVLMKKEFHPVSIHEEIIDNPQDAFFTLYNWACCDKMLSEKSIEDVQDYQKLYQELKQFGGSFYERLLQESWTSTYEHRLENMEER